MTRKLVFGAACLLTAAALAAQRPAKTPERLFVDATKGRDSHAGTKRRPLRSLSAALAKLPDPLRRSVTIEIIGGSHATTGGVEMRDNVLELSHRMRPGVEVRLIGRSQQGAPPVFAWKGGRAMVDARVGTWRLENLQIGTGSTEQRRGVMVEGPAQLTAKDTTLRTRSFSDAGLYAHRGGRIELRGTIRLNEHLHKKAPDESFCGIIATDHGTVQFREREGASLELGNGSLSVSYYGCIRLGCATAVVTSWTKSNPLALANGGRIDLHKQPRRRSARDNATTPPSGPSTTATSWPRTRTSSSRARTNARSHCRSRAR